MPVGEWDAQRGDQATLDRGLVVFWGEPCAHLWLAAHRSTHGAPFARLPETKPGDHWEVTSPSVAARAARFASSLGSPQHAFMPCLA